MKAAQTEYFSFGCDTVNPSDRKILKRQITSRNLCFSDQLQTKRDSVRLSLKTQMFLTCFCCIIFLHINYSMVLFLMSAFILCIYVFLLGALYMYSRIYWQWLILCVCVCVCVCVGVCVWVCGCVCVVLQSQLLPFNYNSNMLCVFNTVYFIRVKEAYNMQYNQWEWHN